MHVHIGAVEFGTFVAYSIIFGVAWNVLAAKLAASDNPTLQVIASAMSVSH